MVSASEEDDNGNGGGGGSGGGAMTSSSDETAGDFYSEYECAEELGRGLSSGMGDLKHGKSILDDKLVHSLSYIRDLGF